MNGMKKEYTKLDKIWIGTKSNKVSIQEKLQKAILSKIINLYY